MKKNVMKLGFNKSTVAQLSNLEQNNINGAGYTNKQCDSDLAYVTCPVICPFTEEICHSEPVCISDMCHSRFCD